MPDVIIRCPNDHIARGLQSVFLGTHDLMGCENGPTLLSLLIQVFDDDQKAIPVGSRMRVSGQNGVIEIAIEAPDSNVQLVKPRLSQAAILALEDGVYSCVCRLRGPKWNDDGEMLIHVRKRAQDVKYGKHILPAGEWLGIGCWDREWADYDATDIDAEGLIGGDWTMEILSVPQRVESPPASFGDWEYKPS